MANLDDYPVVQVSWFDANAYCKWTNCELPTEAQWEKADRGTDGRTYPWGEEQPECTLANYKGCFGDALPIISSPEGKSPFGVINIAGNVYECVWDYYQEDYYSQRNKKKNPMGPKRGEFRIIRGGSWNNYERELTTTYRHAKSLDLMFNSLGFRCVCQP